MGTIDPISMEVLSNAVLSICEEMGIVLSGTARSPLLRESGDFSCTLHSGNGQLVAQTNTLPALASLARSAVLSLGEFVDIPNEAEPGDIYYTNHLEIGGSHLSDVKAIAPLFHKGEIIAWVANCAHWPDIGGAFAGGYVCATDIFQEGFLIPPVRFFRRNRFEPGDRRFRPEQRTRPRREAGGYPGAGSGGSTGKKTPCGTDRNLRAGNASDLLQGLPGLHGEARTARNPRNKKRRLHIPGQHGQRRHRRTARRHKSQGDRFHDDRISFDFTGSDPQVQGPINATPSVVWAGVNFAVRGVTDALIPINEGVYRPLEVIVPEGCWLNAKHPAPRQHSTHETGHRVIDCTLGALARAVPDRVPAAMHGTSSILIMCGDDTRLDPPEFFMFFDCVAGGFGGRPDKDGIDGIRTGHRQCDEYPR